MKYKKKIDLASDLADDLDMAKLNTLKNKNIREVANESIYYQAIRQLKIDSYLKT